MNLPEPNPTTLESWKEIAAYLQRDAKTARRWEKEEGLPIHRHNHNSRSSVYAHPAEIDAWRATRKSVPDPPGAARNRFWRVPAFVIAILLCLMMVGNSIRPQAASAEQGMNAKRVLVPKGHIGYETLSADGQWLGGTDWETGDLVLTRLSSGETKRMVRGAFRSENSWAEVALWSPDQKQIAYWWYNDAETKAKGQLRLMPNSPGAPSRVLLDSPGGPDGAYPVGWSPDGKRILVKLGKLDQGRRSRDFVWVTVADGSVQTIKTLDPWNAGRGVSVRLSPDGRYIAYSARMARDTPDTAVYLLSADGHTQTELAGGGVNTDPIWTPDSSRILFTSNRSGALALWSVPVQNGRKTSVPALFRPQETAAHSLGISRSGELFYANDVHVTQILVAEMDLATGKARSGAPTESFVGLAPAWSPEGKWLAFNHPSPVAGELVLHSLEKGTDWKFPVGGIDDARAIWHPDGMLQVGRGRPWVTVNDGSPKTIAAPVDLPRGALSPDGKLLYVRRENEQIAVIDAISGQQKGMFRVPGGAIGGAVSPDGKTLSILSGRGLARINVDGSDYRELAGDVYTPLPAPWTRDGRAILFVKEEKNSDAQRIMRIPAEGGTPEFTGIRAEDLRDFDLSPDGTKIAYVTGAKGEEIWAIAHVPPALK